MQVKKFEAPTLQEALDTIKRELGPEAIILQTKQNRRGFGLMSKGSVEVTAAVSERAIEKKAKVEKRLPEAYVQKVGQAPASKQADLYESYLEKRVEKDQVQINAKAQNKRITATRYADIADDSETLSNQVTNPLETYQNIPEVHTPKIVGNAIDRYSDAREESIEFLKNEVDQLKRLVDELRRDKNRPEYLDTDSPFSATEALQEGFETLVQAGVDRRFAVKIMRDLARKLSVEARADSNSVLDSIAAELMNNTRTRNIFNTTEGQAVLALTGVSGSGKTATVAKLATHAVRKRGERVGIIRINLGNEEGVDPLTVFAKALHVPYRSVNNREELQVAIQDMSQCARIFIDTGSISPKDNNQIKRLNELLTTIPSIQVNFVMNATTRNIEMREQGQLAKALNASGLVFTRLDEALSFGGIFSISNRTEIPLTVFSTGKKVTEQWENASNERLTASILSIL